MKIICIGYGSSGQRHVRNLRALRPDARVVTVDPQQPGVDYADWHDALIAHPDANGAVIASPTDCHGAQMDALATIGIPFYCEKPLGTTRLPRYALDACAVGFQYRFHPAMREVERMASRGLLRFVAFDSLLGRYGPHVAEIMASHPIDTAIRFLGPVERVELTSDGVTLNGSVHHARGRSQYDIDMDNGPRASRVDNRTGFVDLPPDDSMYVEALRAWLAEVETGEHVAPLATVADGLAVEQVLNEVRYVHPR